MQWLHFEKKNSFKLYYKEVYNIDLPFQEMDFSKKKLCGRPTIQAKYFYLHFTRNPPKIKLAKFNNLMQLL